MKRLSTLVCALTMALAVASPAVAETIHLKNGTRVTGTITKEDAETLVVETKDGRRKVAKADVELLPTPDPAVALATGLLLAGGGHVYSGMYDRAALYLGLGGLGAAAGFVAAGQVRLLAQYKTVTALAIYSVPLLIGAYDAFKATETMGQSPKYRVEYDSEE